MRVDSRARQRWNSPNPYHGVGISRINSPENFAFMFGLDEGKVKAIQPLRKVHNPRTSWAKNAWNAAPVLEFLVRVFRSSKLVHVLARLAYAPSQQATHRAVSATKDFHHLMSAVDFKPGESSAPATTDIVIIGGGIMGCATAYFLKVLSPSRCHDHRAGFRV